MTDEKKFAEVAVDAPLRSSLTYEVPRSLLEKCRPGIRVLVPLGKRKVTGYLVSLEPKEIPDENDIKPIIAALDSEPLFPSELSRLFAWAANYYQSPLFEVIKTALPPGVNVGSRKKAELTEAGRALVETLSGAETKRDKKVRLGPAQAAVLRALAKKGAMDLKALKSAAGLKNPDQALKSLEQKGLVKIFSELPGPRVKAKKVKAIRLVRRPSLEEREKLVRKAPRQDKLLTILERTGGLATLRRLREEMPDPSPPAKALSARGFVEFLEVFEERAPFSLSLPCSSSGFKLMPEQAAAVSEISKALEEERFQVFLLEGVTGSGKTEVYLRAIEKALELGGGAIMLAPEIALTPQLISRFQERFSEDLLAVLHSGLSPGERHDQWWRIQKGKARVVVGARSALFAPVSGLKLLVVDEEQDPAYKQDHGFMYNARDLAVMRGKMENAAVVLGSATPSLESAHRARAEGKYRLLILPRRVDERPLPEVEVVDLREVMKNKPAAVPLAAGEIAKLEPFQGKEDKERLKLKDQDLLTASLLISEPLRQRLSRTLDQGGQAILFLNRRGVSSFLFCLDCGNRFLCPNCSVSLVHHQGTTAKGIDPFYGKPGREYLLCHYCGYHEPFPEVCPRCRGVRVLLFGAGTIRMEEALAKAFPQARIARMDSDVMTSRESYFRFIDRLCRKEVDIVVGTQMVAKGHDLPEVTLSAALLADLSLNLPDFRAAERTFQVLTQLAGRAGRGERPGRVVIQTFEPSHYAVECAVRQDFPGFYQQELARRRALFYPPFSRLANLRIHGPNREAVKEAAKELGRNARRKAGSKAFREGVRLLGPAAAPISRIRGRTRWMLMIKARDHGTLSRFLAAISEAVSRAEKKGVKIEVDRDPVSLM